MEQATMTRPSRFSDERMRKAPDQRPPANDDEDWLPMQEPKQSFIQRLFANDLPPPTDDDDDWLPMQQPRPSFMQRRSTRYLLCGTVLCGSLLVSTVLILLNTSPAPAPITVEVPAKVRPQPVPTPRPVAPVVQAPVVQAPLAPAPAPRVAPVVPQAVQAPVVQPRQAVVQAAPVPSLEPQMVPIAGGSYQMGSTDDPTEQPVHHVTVAPFFMAAHPVTIGEWRQCVNARGCSFIPDGDDNTLIGDISWNDAQQYVTWLAKTTHRQYRLPSEAEWEYAVRGGTDTRFWWGNSLKAGYAICKGCGNANQTRPANPFGLYDIGGGVTEWVADCWSKDYHGASTDGSPRLGECQERVIRGAAPNDDPSYVRSSNRDHYNAAVRYPTHGLRVARSL